MMIKDDVLLLVINEAKKQEEVLRGFIRQLISEASVSDAEDAPHKSTGINILEDLSPFFQA